VGDPIDEDQSFHTQPGAQARILLEDGSVLDFGAQSTAKLIARTDKAPLTLQLDAGKVRALIRKEISSDRAKFAVRTPSSLCVVRGTDFVVESTPDGDKSRDQVTVISGVVDAGQISRMAERLSAGSQWSIAPSAHGMETHSRTVPKGEGDDLVESIRPHDSTYRKLTTAEGHGVPKEIALVTAGIAAGAVPPPAPSRILGPVLIPEPIQPLDRADSSFSQQVLSGAINPGGAR
jgi:hypothetical protein